MLRCISQHIFIFFFIRKEEIMTFNRYTVHSAVPSTKVQLLKSPHGFIAVIDTGKYLITNTGICNSVIRLCATLPINNFWKPVRP